MITVGVSIAMIQNKQLLLGIRKNSSAEGLYSTPGGRLEENEDILTCAIREAKEETGVILDNPEMVYCMEHFRYEKHYIMFYVFVTRWKGNITNLEPNKCEEWLWFDLNSLPMNCTEPIEVIEKLKEKVKCLQ